MGAKVEEQISRFDRLKWSLVVALIVAGLGANYYFTDQILALRIVGWILLLAFAAFIAAQTNKGQQTLVYMREARVEMRKVVWPTRQETVQTTVVVVLMVIVMSLILWGVDSILLWAVGLLTG